MLVYFFIKWSSQGKIISMSQGKIDVQLQMGEFAILVIYGVLKLYEVTFCIHMGTQFMVEFAILVMNVFFNLY